MRTCEICGCGLLGAHTRCHRCETRLARALVARMTASSKAHTDFGRGIIHSPRHEEPGRGALAEAEAILRAHWMEHSGEGFGE